MNIAKDSVLGFSIIDNRLKIFVKQGSLSQSQNNNQQSNTQESDTTPNINNREGEITYYKFIEENNLDNSEIIEPSNPRAFYEGWKQGNNYYVRVNLNSRFLTLIQRPDSFLDHLFGYIKNNSATQIKNVKPAVFNLSTKKLIKKGEIELL